MRRLYVISSIQEALKGSPYLAETRLYGSEARGEARPESDIDLLILLDKSEVTNDDEKSIFARLYPIELQTGIAINPVILPLEQWGQRVTPFYINVENEGIRI